MERRSCWREKMSDEWIRRKNKGKKRGMKGKKGKINGKGEEKVRLR